MFVASVIADFNRNLERLGFSDFGQKKKKSARDESTYEEFLAFQKSVWTPSELYEKCCPRFLAGVVSRRTKSGQYVCVGGCRKVHPTITLYFDVQKSCTIATLSYRLDPFTAYLDKRVKDGSAVLKSPFYYELDGFVRENLHRLRDHQRLFGGHLVKVAIGAMEESDAAQRLLLEDVHRQRYLRRHRICQHCTDFTVSESQPYRDTHKLELVLEICRLWGLAATLDVLSIDCMMRTSRSFRIVGSRMAEHRVKESKFVVTPLVDGHVASGYSVFRRVDTDQQTVFEREGGQIVEYAKCPSILLCQREKDDRDATKNMEGKVGRFLPQYNSSVGFDRRTDMKEFDTVGFSWACEELSFANLELECMDVGRQEYAGQKVIVQWKRSDADVPDFCGNNSVNEKESPKDLQVFCVKLGWAREKVGIVNVSAPHFGLKLVVPSNTVSQVDDVTFSYTGNAKVLECRADFAFLVSAYARSLKGRLTVEHRAIQVKRPLLRHELDFMQQVQVAASLCSVSRHICK